MADSGRETVAGTIGGVVITISSGMSAGAFSGGRLLPITTWLAIAVLGTGICGVIATPRWGRGFICGALTGGAALLAVHLWIYLRAQAAGNTNVPGFELSLAVIIGALPGLLLFVYWADPKRDCVDRDEDVEDDILQGEDLRRELLQIISRHGDINHITKKPLVTLEQFFKGNDDPGSIGYNLGLPDITPQKLYKVFTDIRERPDVSDVLVEVKDMEVPDGWPSTDTVWIITSAIPEEIERWLGHDLRGDDYFTGWTKYVNHRGVKVPYGHKPIGVWWD